MKQRVMCFLLLMCVLLFNGCKESGSLSEGFGSSITGTDTTKLYDAALDEFKYPVENPLLFCADEFGSIACIGRSEKEVWRYSVDGRLSATFSLPENFSVYSLACDEDSIYLLGKYAESSNLVIGEIGSSGLKELYIDNSVNLNYRSHIVLFGECLYFSAVGAEPADVEFSDGFYRHDGTVVYCYNIKTSECETKYTENPLCFVKGSNGIMFYCCDKKGFYFVNFDGEFSYKQYCGLGELYTFCPIGDNAVVFPDNGAIRASLLNGEISSVLVETNVFGNQPFALSAGCLIYNCADENGNNSVIMRIRPQDYIKNLRPIDVIMSINNDTLINTAGYTIGRSVISEKELVMKMLSGDTDWDAAVIYSRQTVATEIAAHEIFQPLNDQVGDYLAECYPCLQSLCKNDGEIWAVPLETNIGCVLYNEKRCAKYGISFSKMSTADFLEKTRELCENDTLKDTEVAINWQLITETLLNDCIYNYGIDSPQFRNTAQLLKENANTVNPPQYMQPTVIETLSDGSVITTQSNAFFGDTDNFLYQTVISYDQALYLLGLNPELSAAEIPFDGKSAGYSFLLMVNPYSDNLEETLMLVRALSEKKLSEIRVNSQPDLNGERQINNIYQSSTVIMGIPDEIYYSDYEKYLADKITLDDFIFEASRKMSAYMNE